MHQINDEDTGAAPDAEIVRRILGGEVEAFDLLLRRHGARIFGIVSRRVRQEDVETVAQDVFVSAFRSLRGYEGRQPLENWLARIARRRCCDYWRLKERQIDTSEAPVGEDQRAWLERMCTALSAEAFDRECGREEAADTVQAVLARLGADDRALIESIYFDDLPLREVATTMRWSVAKVKVRAYRARKRLRGFIEALFDEGERHEQ